MRTAGMVTVGSAPPKPAGGSPATLSAITTAIAPAACAFRAFTVNPQVPRSTNAILPATAEAFVIAVQPSVVEGPAAFAASVANTKAPLKPGEVSAGPNVARPT